MSVPCPCVTCEVDRERGRPQYVVRWRSSGARGWSGRYYTYSETGNRTDDQRRATRFGPRHEFGAHFVRVRIRQGARSR